ncbi:MAG: protein translocase subunit SecD [Candidatus Omnitrophica bacterium]|nr:protein translocase subunit SecD [Candidatus Omnitrophota bacterium]MBU1932867.1 protein translocase subunit SecD [Candidatus Omnitrophota bacterium]
MTKNMQWRILVALGVVGFALAGMLPLKEKINLGLDLQGGMHLVLKVDTSKIPEEAREDAPNRALEIIRNRIDQFGVREPLIQRQGKDSIVVQLPGVTDRDRAIELIGRTAQLEFKLIEDNEDLNKQADEGNVPEGYELKTVGKETLLLKKKSELTGDTLVAAEVKFDQSRFNEPYISLEFNSKGAAVFADVTGRNVGKRLAIVLDGKVHSAPRINEKIPSGKASISGRFSVEEASDLSIVLRAGALPAPLYIEEERTVGALLGRDSIESGIRASLIGLCLVLGFMLLYYLFAGVVASIVMLLNFVIVLGMLGWLHTTLTLPGIAGLILVIGMAVDANVLIYERIREELTTGKHIRSAVGAGYNKAFTAILDSNITTLIAAALLFKFGTGPIRGFGVTLSIGIVASMFTAIFVTRIIFDLVTANKHFTKLPMLQMFRKTKIDFIGKRWIAYVLSTVVLVVGISAFFTKGEKAYGIDFTGGQLQEYSFARPVKVEDVRKILYDMGIKDATIQLVGEDKKEVLVKTSEDVATSLKNEFDEKFTGNRSDILRVEKVGPSIGKHLRKSARLAVLWSLIGILLYVGFRFKNVAFATAGVIALFHDVFVTMGFLAITGRELNLTIVAALLTIAGYSINDTIVIYDRIRENMKLYRKATMKEIVNMSVNQTLSRTVLTTFTTLLAVTSIFFFGGEVLRDFSFALLIGMISGIYSTIYIASPLVIFWHAKGRR